MGLAELLRDWVRALLRVVFFALGLCLMGVMVLVGLSLALVLVVWSLLRGRRPQWQFQRMGTARERWPGFPPGGFGRGGNRATPGAADDDVIDVQAREVDADASPASRPLPRR